MTTDSNMPLASATPPVASPSPRVSTRARSRVRAKIPATLRDGKIGRIAANIAADMRNCWVLAAQPPALAEWLKSTKPSTNVPDSPLLRLAWRVDAWTTGLVLLVASVVLFLAAGAMAYLRGNPLRRWSVLLVSAAFIVYLLYGR